jgi:hypothetical protein
MQKRVPPEKILVKVTKLTQKKPTNIVSCISIRMPCISALAGLKYLSDITDINSSLKYCYSQYLRSKS